MTARQGELLPKPPPRRRGQLMHVCDVDTHSSRVIVQLQCAKCEHQSDWIEFATVTGARLGLPCPRCADTGSDGPKPLFR